MKIGLIPIDNRPVCYTLPKLIAGLDAELELLMPERKLLGDLTKPADTDAIPAWIETLENVDAFVIALDTVAYGGLIPSRRSPDTFEEIRARLGRLKSALSGKKVYAFSSIMRISNNNVNQEEKTYWDKWGKKIFEYSYTLHKENKATEGIPQEILEDYLMTRKRNFEINKIYLEWQREGIFDTLIFSKDDCAQYGLNVQEAGMLKSLGAVVKTGADEIPLSLLARAVEGCVKISPIYIEESQKNLISNYEDIPLEECVTNQIELAGCKVVSEEEAEVELFINNFVKNQGEIVMKVQTEPFRGEWSKPDKNYAVADVRFANGADNAFVKALFDAGLDDKFLGYCAWNTSANTLGSLIFALKLTILAKEKGTFNEDSFNRLMLTRFLDDWAYQANVRQELGSPDLSALKQKMSCYEKNLIAKFPATRKINYEFPWNRLFEVEIDFI